jgi:hypothetical protein
MIAPWDSELHVLQHGKRIGPRRVAVDRVAELGEPQAAGCQPFETTCLDLAAGVSGGPGIEPIFLLVSPSSFSTRYWSSTLANDYSGATAGLKLRT